MRPRLLAELFELFHQRSLRGHSGPATSVAQRVSGCEQRRAEDRQEVILQ